MHGLSVGWVWLGVTCVDIYHTTGAYLLINTTLCVTTLCTMLQLGDSRKTDVVIECNSG